MDCISEISSVIFGKFRVISRDNDFPVDAQLWYWCFDNPLNDQNEYSYISNDWTTWPVPDNYTPDKEAK